MTAPRPFPGDLVPDRVDEPFWSACLQHRFLLFTCGECGRALWPAGSCPRHGMAGMRWTPASGDATLVSWTVVHQRYGNSFADPPPNVAVVETAEGALMHTTILGAGTLAVGMALRVDFAALADGVVAPVFRPADAGERDAAGTGES